MRAATALCSAGAAPPDAPPHPSQDGCCDRVADAGERRTRSAVHVLLRCCMGEPGLVLLVRASSWWSWSVVNSFAGCAGNGWIQATIVPTSTCTEDSIQMTPFGVDRMISTDG